MKNELLLGCLCLLASCSFFQKTEIDLKYPPIWEHNFNVGYFSTIEPILHQNKVIYSGLDEKKNDFSANSTLEAFNKKNGKLIWKWEDNVMSNSEQFVLASNYFTKDNILYISTRWDYAINLNNGKTEFNNNQDKLNGVDFFGNSKKLFTSYVRQDGSSTTVEYTNFLSFHWDILFQRENSDTSIHYFRYFLFDEKRSSHLYVPYSKWNGTASRPYLLIYDLDEKKIISDNALDVVPGSRFIDYRPVMKEDKIYLSLHGHVACVDKKTATVIWQTNTKWNSSRSGIMYADNKLFVNTEFQLYALDAETGNILWQIDSSAGSRMQEHKGVVYYTDGISLRGVDATSGEVLLEVDAPSQANDDGAFFQPVLTIDHENDRIYTASYTHAYCYRTLR